MSYHETTLEKVYESASCSDHPLTVRDDELIGAATLVAVENYDGGYDDSDSFAIARLSTGKYLVVSEWSDSSGHGCQCGGTAAIFGTLEEALHLGLGDDHRKVAVEFWEKANAEKEKA